MIAICTPVHSTTTRLFTKCLADLMAHAAKAGRDPRFIMVCGSNLPFARSELARMALSEGAEAILWLDADQSFPADTLDRLLAHDQPFVGCNYSTKQTEPRPTATGLDGKPVSDGNGLGRVGGLGFGVLLTARKVFEKVPLPWFQMQMFGDGNRIGEDRYFCTKADQAGFRIMCDHDLSREIGHIGEKIYTL